LTKTKEKEEKSERNICGGGVSSLFFTFSFISEGTYNCMLISYMKIHNARVKETQFALASFVMID
jgi:hypothetical protein